MRLPAQVRPVLIMVMAILACGLVLSIVVGDVVNVLLTIASLAITSVLLAWTVRR